MEQVGRGVEGIQIHEKSKEECRNFTGQPPKKKYTRSTFVSHTLCVLPGLVMTLLPTAKIAF